MGALGRARKALAPEPHAVRELGLFIENDSGLYHQMETPIQKALTRRKAAGTYDHDKAEKAYYNLATEGARRYTKTYSSYDGEGPPIFSTADRHAVAREMRDSFEAEHRLGNYDQHIPKKYRK
jgi:hypothetical protein